MPEIDRGTIAAAVPIDVPTIMRVSGITATRRMMNGSERKPLTIAPTLPLGRRGDENKPQRQADGEADRARDRRHHQRLAERAKETVKKEGEHGRGSPRWRR